MRTWLLLLPAILAAPAPAQEAAGQNPQTVVVTGTPLDVTERRMKECLARSCPPAEDIAASAAHAENLVIAGEYGAARRVLGAARRRNGSHAAEMPNEVAGLIRPHARVLDVDGFARRSGFAHLDALDALKEGGVDRAAPRALTQRIEVGDSFARQARLRAANGVYKRVEKAAWGAGLPHIAGHAMLRQAMLYSAVASVDPSFAGRAEKEIRDIEATAAPELAPFRQAAKFLRASNAAKRGDMAVMERALADTGALATDRPVLLFAPVVRLPKDDLLRQFGNMDVPRGVGVKPEWVDIRFVIDPDGKVADSDVIRKSDGVIGDWPQRVASAIALRRYAPVALPQGSPRLTRIERFTMVYDMVEGPASRMMVRRGVGRLVSLDITPET